MLILVVKFLKVLEASDQVSYKWVSSKNIRLHLGGKCNCQVCTILQFHPASVNWRRCLRMHWDSVMRRTFFDCTHTTIKMISWCQGLHPNAKQALQLPLRLYGQIWAPSENPIMSFFIILVTCWLATCAWKSKVPDLSLVASYVQRWVIYSNCQANVLMSVQQVEVVVRC